MANALNLNAPKYAAPADWHTASVTIGALPPILRTGTYLASQSELDDVVDDAIAAGVALVYLDIPPMGYTEDPRLSNPEAFYPTPSLLAEMIASAGNAETAKAVNATITGTGLSANGGIGAIITIPSTAISVPKSNGRPVMLEYGAGFAQTTVGSGIWVLSVYETTGAATQIAYGVAPLPNSVTVADQQRTIDRRFPLGVVTSTRTFELRSYLFANPSNAPAGSIYNDTDQPSFLRAVLG